jgi:cytidine deaminase
VPIRLIDSFSPVLTGIRLLPGIPVYLLWRTNFHRISYRRYTGSSRNHVIPGLKESQQQQLMDAARRAAANAHSPHSGFQVGAALLDVGGHVYAGCNVESASYGLTCCAERSALFTAIAAGVKAGDIVAMVIYTPGKTVFTCCGACRQVMHELMAPDSDVILFCDSEQQLHHTTATLLPDPFDLNAMNRARE